MFVQIGLYVEHYIFTPHPLVLDRAQFVDFHRMNFLFCRLLALNAQINYSHTLLHTTVHAHKYIYMYVNKELYVQGDSMHKLKFTLISGRNADCFTAKRTSFPKRHTETKLELTTSTTLCVTHAIAFRSSN